MQAGDLPVHGGRTLAYVYDSGLPDVDRIGRAAVARFAGSNGLDPTAFPSLLAMENDLVGFACRPARGPGRRGRHGHLRRHRVGAARGADRPRQPARRGPAADGAARHRARGVPQGRALLRGRGACWSPSTRVPGRPGGDGRRDRRRPRPHRARGGLRAVVRPRRDRPGRRDRRRSPPRAGSAATSTRASAAGCCRTPRGWGATCRRGLRGRGRHVDLGRPAQVRATPPRAPRCCCTAAAPGAARSSSPRRAGRATRCSTPRCSRRSPAARSRGRGRSSSRSATRAT